MTGALEDGGEREDGGECGDGRPDGRVGLGELVALSVQGGWRFLAAAVRHGQPVGWMALACVPAYGYVAAGRVRWGSAVVAGAAVPLLACQMGVLGQLLQARAGRGGRRLLLDRSPAGRAFLVVVPDADEAGGPVWQLENLVGLPAKGVPRPADRARRPGARLVRRTIGEARRLGVGVRLVAADRDVARKVYEPVGLVYDAPDEVGRRQPRMHLPAGPGTAGPAA